MAHEPKSADQKKCVSTRFPHAHMGHVKNKTIDSDVHARRCNARDQVVIKLPICSHAAAHTRRGAMR